MDKNKLISLSNKLGRTILKKYSGKMKPGDAYSELRKEEQYNFLFRQPNGLIVIICFLVSIPESQRESQFDNIVSNLFTFTYYVIESDEVDDECGDCYGSGQVDCSNCNGDGKIDCDECGGDGEDSDGDTCNNCDGEGNFECDHCNSSGQESCDRCDGEGYINLDNTYEIEQYYCASYDPKIFEICEMYEEDEVVVSGDIDTIQNRKKTMVLYADTRNIEESNYDLHRYDIHFYGYVKTPEFYGTGNYISDTYLNDKN
jgi:hypothetical protein